MIFYNLVCFPLAIFYNLVCFPRFFFSCLFCLDTGHAWHRAVEQQVRRKASTGQVRHGRQDGPHMVQEEHGPTYSGAAYRLRLLNSLRNVPTLSGTNYLEIVWEIYRFYRRYDTQVSRSLSSPSLAFGCAFAVMLLWHPSVSVETIRVCCFSACSGRTPVR